MRMLFMDRQVAWNVRYLLVQRGVAPADWENWLQDRLGWKEGEVRALVSRYLLDERITERQLRDLARAFDLGDALEDIRFRDMPGEAGDGLLRNLRHLIASLEHGGKRALAQELEVDPTTISRWLNGSYPPKEPSLRKIASFFGLPADTDLRRDPVYLAAEPISQIERRQWVHERIDRLTADELADLFPALQRMLEER